jgi:hypothetical protein
MIERDDKTSQQAKIRKGLPPTRDPACYEVQQDIVIPAGTMLRSVGDDKFAAALGLGNTTGEVSITVKPGVILPAGTLRRVIA